MTPLFSRTTRLACWWSIATTLAITSCVDTKIDTTPRENDEPPIVLGSDACDPIDPSMCALPWPSNLYLEADTKTETGVNLQFKKGTLPLNTKPDTWHSLDGYGLSTSIMFRAGDLNIDDLPQEANLRASWDGEIGRAQLFKVEADNTLTRIPFWAEQELRDEDKLDNPLTFLRPAQLLEEGSRYIVMLRNLRDKTGNPIPKSEAFDRLVRGDTDNVPELRDRQERFDDVFALLEQTGIPADELYLAWDFYTASHNALHGPMIQARDLVLQKLQDNGGGTAMTIESIDTYQRDDQHQPHFRPYTHYIIKGTFTAPQIVRPHQKGFNLNTDDDGILSLYDTPKEQPFSVRIPYAASNPNTDKPTRLVEFGHGLLGGTSEVLHGNIGRIADDHQYIFFGAALSGMSKTDVGSAILALTDIGKFRLVGDHLHQGIMDYITISKAMMHSFFDLPELDALDDIEQIRANVDTSTVYYEGISQGAIFGPTFMAVSPDVNLGHLDAAGNNYNMLISRSVDFVGGYDAAILLATDGDHTDANILLAAAQILWDMTDSATWYRHLSKDPLPGNQEKKVIIHTVRGDMQVPPVSELVAANSDLGVAVMPGWGEDITHMGLQETPFLSGNTPHNGSGIVMLHYKGIPWAPKAPTPAHPNGIDDPHNLTRFMKPLIEQWTHFIENDGEWIDTCNGQGCYYAPAEQEFCDTNIKRYPAHEDNRMCWVLTDPANAQE